MSGFAHLILPLATPDPEFDPNSVTPTWVGFLITFLVALATLALIIDMVRRIRRTRYRGEIRELLDAEEAARQAEGIDPSGTDPSGSESSGAEPRR